MSEPRDPRHQLIIDLIIKYRETGYDDKAKELQEKAANIATFEELDLIARNCKQLLEFIDR